MDYVIRVVLTLLAIGLFWFVAYSFAREAGQMLRSLWERIKGR
jgi:hypothetical protein